MIALWRKTINWIETGDLIFPVVAVSAAHYAVVLSGKDLWVIAFIIGVLVDLGHYRIIKAAIRYGGWFYLAALVMTALAFGFHLAFYGGGDWRDLMASAAMPVCIMFLAGLSVREKWAQKNTKANTSKQLTNEQPNEQRTEPKAKRGEAKQRILEAHGLNPTLTVTELATMLGVSKAHVSEVLSHQNGNGHSTNFA